MTQDGNNFRSTSPFSKVPITDNHYLLPPRNDKFAPKPLLDVHTKRAGLDHFLDIYKQLCFHYDVISPAEKCKGLYNYSTDEMARMIANIPAYIKGDYSQLVKYLYYFLDNEDEGSYNQAEVDHFTRKWRKRAIDNHARFKTYHRKFLALVGQAIGIGTISHREYNRYFWEGIHSTLRKRIEERLMMHDPDLDLSVPFKMDEVVQAVSAIFNQKRFDRHLFSRKGYRSDSDSEEDNYKPSKVHSESEDDSDSDQSDWPRKRRSKKKPAFTLPPKPSPRRDPTPPRRADRDEVMDLTQQMKDLKLLLSQKDSGQQESSSSRQNSFPYGPPSQTQQTSYGNSYSFNRSPSFNRPFPFQRPFNPPSQSNPQNSNPSSSQPPRQYVNASFSNPPQRDSPPHLSQNPPSARTPQDFFCYGCGQTGHRMMQCTDLNTLINQGTIVQNGFGKYCWPDGSYIFRDRGEPLVQAVNKTVKRTNAVRAHIQGQETKEEYRVMEVTREDSDASSDEQEELGWQPRLVADCYAMESSPKVSREARRQVQSNIPGRPQQVEQLPIRSNAIRPRRTNVPIGQGKGFHSNQPGPIPRPTPFDVHQNEFKGKTDDKFLPMDVDESLPVKPGNHLPKEATNQSRTNPVKATNPGTAPEKVSMGIVQDIMNRDVTVRLGPLIEISPIVRRGLLDAMKGTRGAARPTLEQKEKDEQPGKSVFGTAFDNPSKNLDSAKWEARDELLTLSVRIGDVILKGIFDSGSQANIISEEYAKLSGLPIQMKDLGKVRISGIEGNPAKCVGIIPNASIFVTDNELETFGQLLVIRDATFDLLLGRPWGSGNGGGIREAPEGTYLIFESHGIEYQVNVSPSRSHKRRLRELGSAVYAQRIEEAREGDLRVGAISYIPGTPDREPEQDILEYCSEDWEDPFDSQEIPEPGGNKPKIDSEEEESEEAEEDSRSVWDNAKGKGKPTPGSICKATAQRTSTGSIVVESDLQERLIKWIQKGRNEPQWDKLCQTEKQLQKKEKEEWRSLKKDREREPEEEDIETIPLDIAEPSQTLAHTPPHPPKRPRSPEPDVSTTVTSERRSCRIRRATDKAQDSKYWRKHHQQSFERRDKRTRKSITTRNDDIPDRALVSLGALVSCIEERSNQGSPSASQENPSEDPQDPTDTAEGKRQSKQKKSRKKRHRGNPGPSKKSPRTNSNLPEANRPVPENMRLASRRLRTQEDKLAKGWRIGPGDETIDLAKTYPWISRGEVERIAEWIEGLPYSSGKFYFIHALDEDVLAVTLIAREDERPRNLQTNGEAQILRLWRNVNWDWLAIPQHSMKCAWRSVEEPKGCKCGLDLGWADPAFIIPHEGSEEVFDEDPGSPQISEWTDEDEAEEQGRIEDRKEEVRKDEKIKEKDTDLVVSEEEPEDGLENAELALLLKKRLRIAEDPPPERAPTPEIEIEPDLEDWTHDDGRYQETHYRYGNSTLTIKDLSRAANPGDQRVRDASEIPDTGKLLGRDGTYDPTLKYPLLTADETRDIMTWGDSQPDSGGKEYMFWKTKRGTIAITDMKAGRNTLQDGQSQRIIELERNAQGKLQEVGGTCTRYEGRFPKDPHPDSESTTAENDETRSLTQEPHPETEPTTGGANGVRELRIFAARVEGIFEKASDTEQDLSGKEEEVRDEEDLMEGTHTLGPDAPPQEDSPENERNLNRIVQLSFPPYSKVRVFDAPAESGFGLLASQQIVPLMQYDRTRDFEFLARRATLCWYENGRMRSCRGDAAIRISERNPDPGPTPPSRRRVKALCKRMFVTETAGPSRTGATAESHRRWAACDIDYSSGSRESESGSGEGRSKKSGVEMSRDELGAIMEQLDLEDDMKINEKRAYEMIKDSLGRVTVVRIPRKGRIVRQLEKDMAEVEVRGGRERRAQGTDTERLTESGNDPPTSEERLPQTDEIEGKSPSSPNERNPTGPGDAYALPATDDVIPETLKRIKEEQPTHQEESPPLIFFTPPSQPTTPSPTPPSTNCPPMMLTSPPPRVPTPPAQRILAAAYQNPAQANCVQQVAQMVSTRAPSFDIDPSPGHHRPGIIAAAHLTRTACAGLDRPDLCLFGYGASIEIEEPDGVPRILHGNIAVLLYTPPYPSTASTLRPPPPDRMEAVRVQLFRRESHTRCPTETNPFLPGYRRPPPYALPASNETARVHPFTRGAGGDVKREVEEGEITAAKTLVSLRAEDEKEKRDLPVSDAIQQPEEAGKSQVTERPLQRGITFVPGGILPGTVPSEPSKEKPVPEQRPTTMPLTGTPPTNDAAPPKAENERNDDEMAIDSWKTDSPDTLPRLLSPSIDDDYEPRIEEIVETPRRTDGATDLPNTAVSPQKPRNLFKDSPIPDKVPFDVSETTGVSYREWRERLDKIERFIDNGMEWSDIQIGNLFDEMKMIRWWCMAEREMRKKEKAEWKGWKQDRVREWMERYPSALPMVFRWMANDVERIMERIKPLRILAVRKEKSQPLEDVEMVETNVPATPAPTPIPIDDRSPSPEQPPPPIADSPKDQFDNLKDQVKDLERTVDRTGRKLRERVSELEGEMATEKCATADLRWKMTDVEAALAQKEVDDNGGWREVRRKGLGRGRGKVRHGYSTRYAAAQGYAPTTSWSTTPIPRSPTKELDELKERVEEMEGRAEEQQKEVKRLSEEVSKVEALTRQVTDLGEAVDKIRANQNEIGISMTKEISRLNGRVDGEVYAYLKNHDRELAALLGHYQMLHSFATGLLNYQASLSAPAHSTVNPKAIQAPIPNFRPAFVPHKPVSVFPQNQSTLRHSHGPRSHPTPKTITF